MSLYYYHFTIDAAGEVQAFNRTKVNQLSPTNVPSIVTDDFGVTSLGVFIDESLTDPSGFRGPFMSSLTNYVDWVMTVANVDK
jgi:hypothetical protein